MTEISRNAYSVQALHNIERTLSQDVGFGPIWGFKLPHLQFKIHQAGDGKAEVERNPSLYSEVFFLFVKADFGYDTSDLTSLFVLRKVCCNNESLFPLFECLWMVYVFIHPSQICITLCKQVIFH